MVNLIRWETRHTLGQKDLIIGGGVYQSHLEISYRGRLPLFWKHSIKFTAERYDIMSVYSFYLWFILFTLFITHKKNGNMSGGRGLK